MAMGIGRCGLAWRGGGLGTGGHGLGGKPRVEAGEGRGGSRARTTSGQKPACADTPRLRSNGTKAGANMCSLSHPNHWVTGSTF